MEFGAESQGEPKSAKVGAADGYLGVIRRIHTWIFQLCTISAELG